jgi:two-component system cell cycle response regulator
MKRGYFPRTFWYSVTVAVLFIGLLLVWLLLKPGSHDLFIGGDMLTLPVSLIIGMIISFSGGSWRLPRTWASLRESIHTSQFWIPIAFLFVCLHHLIAQIITLYLTFTASMILPGASWADFFFLTSYPAMVIFFLLLPTHFSALLGRTRIVLNTLIVMTTAVIFSWYFILGPIFLQSKLSLLDKIMTSAYPLCDLTLIFCLLQLATRTTDVKMRPAIFLFALATSILVFLDCSIEYKTLSNNYYLGTLLDICMPTAYLCYGLAFRALRIVQLEQADEVSTEQLVEVSLKQVPILPSFWLIFLPYIFVTIVLGFTCYVLLQGRVDPLACGVYAGSSIIIILVLIRQITLIRAVTNYASMTTELNEELHSANNRLETQATTDPLTGLLNHRALLTILTKEVERAQRYQNACTLLFMDLDHFKALNDGYGHAAGDEVLMAFGQRLHQSVRGIDTVGRWGGEEFIAILPETTMKEAHVIAERIRATVGQQSFAIGGGLYLTCSIGIASYPTHATDLNALINAADQAMYAAKRLGRNQYRSIDDPVVQTVLTGESGESDREGTALRGFVDALITMLESRDAALGSHSYEVATLVNRIALQLGVSSQEARMMHLAGQLHDIGKVGVPDAILYKPIPLTKKEWQQMRKHPEVGAEILTHIPALRPLAPAIRAHYEHWDGTGYPDQLRADAIPLAARVIAVADAYLTLTMESSNLMEARSSEEALMELQDAAGTQFDPAVVDALSTLLSGQHQERYLHLVG